MEIFRITKAEYANLDGIGGLMVSGRWHEKGVRVVYFSENRALAILEYLVHIGDKLLLPDNLVLLTLQFPDDLIFSTVDSSTLPGDWKNKLLFTRHLGTKFLIEKKNLLLKVPSVIVSDEYNFLFNPLHNDSSACKITSQPFIYDERVL